jgi:hypothetical protein
MFGNFNEFLRKIFDFTTFLFGMHFRSIFVGLQDTPVVTIKGMKTF